MKYRTYSLAAALFLSAFGGAKAADEQAIKAAAVEIIHVLKAQGPAGMQAYVQSCYAQDPVSMHCFYLDTGAFQINGTLAALMNTPRNPYFVGLPFAQRIGPIMKRAGVPMEQEGVYLKDIYRVQRPALYAAYTAKN